LAIEKFFNRWKSFHWKPDFRTTSALWVVVFAESPKRIHLFSKLRYAVTLLRQICQNFKIKDVICILGINFWKSGFRWNYVQQSKIWDKR